MADTPVQEFDQHITDLEKFMTLNSDLLDKEGSEVKKKVARTEFADRSAKIRDFLEKNYNNRDVMLALFQEGDRSARLHYINDTCSNDEALVKSADFCAGVDQIVASNKFHVDTWEILQAKGQLKVGFGECCDNDYKNEILVEAGQEPIVEEDEEAEEEPDDQADHTIKGVDVTVQNEAPPVEEDAEEDIEKEVEAIPEEEVQATRAPSIVRPHEPVHEEILPRNSQAPEKKKKRRPRPKGPFGPPGWCTKPAGTFTHTLDNKLVMMRATQEQNEASGAKSFLRGLKHMGGVEDDDGVIAISNGPLELFDQGYYLEVEVETLNNNAAGCLGLGVTLMRPKDITKMPRRLEKLKQGWFFSGPYKGMTRRLYRHGKKDIRFILDGEETRPLRWSIGDKMSVLIRPKDWHAQNWQWTITLYINRNIVLACNMDVPPNPDGTIPRKLDLYACSEGFGYVTGVRMKRDSGPFGLQVAGLKK